MMSSSSGSVVREMTLENGQTLVISDCSRKIGADAFVVIMKATMEIRVEEKLFESEPVSGFKFNDIKETLGDTVIYEYRLERNFIMDHEKEAVFDALVAAFWENMGQYVSKPAFPPRLVLKEYKDRL